VDGALAASAPILSFAGAQDSPTFYETITNDWFQADPRCPDLVRSAFNEIYANSQTPAGLAQITSSMNLCKSLTSADLEQLILWAVTAFGNLAMFDYPYASSDFGLPAWPVRFTCQVLLNNTQDLLHGLAQAVGVYYNSTGTNLPCYDIYNEFIFCADQSGCGSGPEAESWDYQCCTELLYFPSTNNITDMFPPRSWNPSDLTAYCQNTWKLTPRFDWTSLEYSPNDYKYASRIIFSNGLLDPWHGGGVLTNYSTSLPALIVTEGAHHFDLRASNPLDPDSVIWVRAAEANYLMMWMEMAREEKGLKGHWSLREDATFPWVEIFKSYRSSEKSLNK